MHINILFIFVLLNFLKEKWQTGEGVQKVKASSYKLSLSWRWNAQHVTAISNSVLHVYLKVAKRIGQLSLVEF